MSTEFKLPELGENIESGDIVNVLVKEGEHIEANQGAFELETEKAVVEVPCPHGGKVVKIHVKKGDRVKVGQTLLTLEAEAEASAPAAPAAKPAPAAQEAPSSKPAPAAPPRAPHGDGSQATKAAPKSSPAPPTMQPAAREGDIIPAGPAARRLARELGVDLRQVEGSGRRGRITPEDVQAAVSARPVAGAAWSPEPVVPPGEPGNDAWGPVRRERVSQIRRAIANAMSRSSSTIPHVTNFDDADVTDLENLRKGVPQGFLGPNLKLTSMPFIMRAVALALRRHPMLNASLDDEKDEVVYKQYVNLGVAVDTPRGLIVPVVRGADKLSIGQLAQALATVAERARSGRFGMEEIRGGTFTISNMGAVGGAYSTPIINHPEVAILLTGRARWLPVIRDGQVVPRLMLPLSLSYDHRLVDGAAAARFLTEVIDLLQTPGKLVL